MIQIKLLAKTGRLVSVDVKPGSVLLAFDPKAVVPEEGVRRLMDRYQRRLRILSPLSFELQLTRNDWPSVFPELSAALQTLVFCGTK